MRRIFTISANLEPMSGEAGELFQQADWFSLLQAKGFEHAPQRVDWAIAPGTALPLMPAAAGGAGLVSLSNYYSGLYGPQGVALAPGWDATAAAQTLRRLPGRGILRLQPLDADAPWLAPLETALRAQGWWTDRFFAFGNWHQPVPDGGFATYWAARPSPLRHSVERGQRRLARAGRWRIDIAQAPGPELAQAAAAYAQVYANSWKQPEAAAGFVPALIDWAAARGVLRLGVLWLDDAPLAVQIWLTQGGVARIFKLAYVQGQEKLSPGSVLTAAMMAHAMDVDRVLEVDYLSGDDAYKADWMAARRERIGLVAFDLRTLAGVTAAARHWAGAGWRKLRRQRGAASRG